MKRTVTTSAADVSIWENFERHADELRALGASPAEIEELRAAAAAVDAVPETDVDLAEALAPRRTCLGLMIQPPTVAARYWARQALARACGGRLPEPGVAEANALLAGLAVLRLWGEGRRAAVLTAVQDAGALAELIAAEAAAAGEGSAPDPDALAIDWLFLMGHKKKAEAMAALRAALSRVRDRIGWRASTGPSSTPRRAPAAGSGSVGRSSGTARRRQSSTGSSNRTRGSAPSYRRSGSA